MYSTLLMTLLATAPMAPSQYYGAYGNYGGAYGAYGAYSGGYVMPYYMYPYVQIGGAEDEKAKAEKEAAEEKLNDIQASYGKLDQRLAGLERLLTTMEPYLKAQETIQEERHKALDVKLEARMQALEKVQAFAGLEGQVTLGLAKLEDRIQSFEARLRGNDAIPDSLMAKLDALGQSNLNIENRLLKIETAAPALPALDGGSNEQVKAMISGVEDKLGLGLTLLEDRLKQMEERLKGPALPELNGGNSTSDTLNQMSRNLEKRFELLEQKLQQKDEFDTKIRSHEREVLDTTIKQNFNKLESSINKTTTTKTVGGDEANRRVNRAVVLITLPADARLYINGMESTVGTNLRTFVTPELEANKHYYYTIRVEVVRNGQLTTDAQRVYFQRGEEVRVSFDHMENAIGGEMLLDRKKNG